MDSFPALLWRIDIFKNQIEYFNQFKVPGLGERCGLILQNIDFARRVVVAEDLHLLERFMGCVRSGETAATVFRIRDEERVRWIKLTGTVYRKNPRYYLGYMLDCSETAAIVQAVAEKEAGGSARPTASATAQSVLRTGGGRQTPDPQARSYLSGLMKKIEGNARMEDILAVLLENQYPGMDFDAIIHSDVHARKNTVRVYSAGAPLRTMAQGEVFPYEGTIAENIERYRLDHLIVDDTFASIKAIDWALFIPHGIRSYFAKPFYDRKALRTVLIFCATARGIFAERKIETYSLLYRPFLAGLKSWRKASRQKKIR